MIDQQIYSKIISTSIVMDFNNILWCTLHLNLKIDSFRLHRWWYTKQERVHSINLGITVGQSLSSKIGDNFFKNIFLISVAFVRIFFISNIVIEFSKV